MFYTYVIKSKKDSKWYTGSADNLRKRFKEHNNNRVFSTKNRGPFELIYYEACMNKYDAIARERYLKTGMGKRYLKSRLKRFLSLTGFTLIELLLVVAILAFLIGIIVIAAANVSERAKRKTMYASLQSLKTSLQAYYLLYGIFPNGTGHPAGVVSLRDDLIENADPEHRLMDNIPEDIFSTASGDSKLVHYELNANNRTFCAWSIGPTGVSEIGVGNDQFTGGPGDDIFVTNAKDEVWTGQ